MIHSRNRVLPQQRLRWNERAKIPRNRPHVAVGQLVPGLGERVSELLRVRMESFCDWRLDRVHLQGEIGGEHERCMLLRLIVGIRYGARSSPVLGSPLV